MQLILAILLCTLSAFLILSLFRRQNYLDQTIALITLIWGQIFLIVLFLGIIGFLAWINIIFTHTFIFFFISVIRIIICIRQKQSCIFLFRIQIHWLKIFFHMQKQPYVNMLVLLTLLLFGYVSFLNYVLPVHDWDGFMYHLFLPANWLQNRSIWSFSAAPQMQLDKWIYFPANIETITAWWLALAGKDDLVEFAQFPIVVSGLLSMVGIIRLFGAPTRYAAWIVPVFLSTPVLYSQLNSSYVDASVAFLYFLTLYLTMRALQRRSGLLAISASLAASMLMGSKATGPLLTATAMGVALIGLILFDIGRRKVTSIIKRVFIIGGLIAFSAIIIGNFFFMRNYLEKSNPLYPYSLKIAGMEIFSGIDPIKQTASSLQNDRRKFLLSVFRDHYGDYPYNYYGHPYAGSGPVAYSFGIPAAILLSLFFIHKFYWRRFLFLDFFLFCGFMATWALPTLFTRFTLILNGTLTITAIAILPNLLFGKNLYKILMVLAISYNFFLSLPMNFHGRWYLEKAMKKESILSASDSPYSGGHYKEIDKLLGDAKVNIAYAALSQPYPLFGRTLSRSVYHFPATTYREWMQRLKQEKIHFIVLGKPGYSFQEQLWVSSHPEQFRLVSSNKKLDAYLFASQENLTIYKELRRNAK